MKKPINFWIMVVVGVGAGLVLIWALAEHAHATLILSGPMGLIFSPTLQHKIGELMIGVPLFLTALTKPIWPTQKVAANLLAAWPLMVLGAALNLLAWFGSDAPWNDVNRLWFALLVVVGPIAPPLIARLLTRKAGA